MGSKKPKKTVAKLKKELDSVFSQYIRLKYANQDGFVNCYTCARREFWKKIQNGHFISRGYLATRYHEDNCRPQCVGCNIYGNGKQVEFSRKLESEKRGITIKLYRLAQAITKDFPYEQKIKHYKKKVETLRHDKNQQD